MEQGLGTAIVQRKDLDKEHLDSAFWLNLAWSLAFVGITFLTAGWWARANDLPELENVIKALSPTIVLWSLSVVQHSAARAADGLQEPCHPSERRGAHRAGQSGLRSP